MNSSSVPAKRDEPLLCRAVDLGAQHLAGALDDRAVGPSSHTRSQITMAVPGIQGTGCSVARSRTNSMSP